MIDTTLQHAVIASAREWIGTPFRHQGRMKKTRDNKGGVDCLGLLVGVAQECDLHGKAGSLVCSYDTLFYGHLPDGVGLRKGLNAALYEKNTAPEMGDIGLFVIDGVARHVAFFGDYAGSDSLSLIHAYAPSRKVVEHRFDEGWHAKLSACFSLNPHD